MKELKRIFEREYMNKGKTKQESDKIFYGFEAKNPLFHHPTMSRQWREQEKKESHATPFTPKWLEKERQEGNHPSIHLNNVNWNKWKLEESKENIHRKRR